MKKKMDEEFIKVRFKNAEMKYMTLIIRRKG